MGNFSLSKNKSPNSDTKNQFLVEAVKDPNFNLNNTDLILQQNLILASEETQYPEKSERELFRITLNGAIESIDHPIWQVVSHKDGPYVYQKTWSVQVGDSFMIGKIKLQVLESNQTIKDSVSLDQVEDQDTSCRFCLNNHNSVLDPLMSICKCRGSMQWIHLQCLRDWVKTKLKETKSISTTFYYIEDLKCQLCKVHINITYQHGNRQYCIIDPIHSLNQYIIMSMENPNPSLTQGVYVIDFEQSQSIKIGSASNCDILIEDKTVSDLHAILIHQGTQVTIQEGQSPNGVLAHNGKNIQLKNKACFVVDNSLFQIKKVKLVSSQSPSALKVQ